MTIASEIQRIKTNIANAYTACDNKGATMPATQNSNNLASCVSSIPTATEPTLASLTITPSTTTQTLTPPSGTDGYNTVSVSAVTSAIDPDIVAGNIKSGVNILGVTGTVTALAGETRTVSITSTSGNTFTPSSGKNGITSIKCNPTNKALTITPTTTSQTFTVPSNYSGYGTVTCNAASGGVTPTGTLSITANGVYDVTNYASADVSVSGGGGNEWVFSYPEDIDENWISEHYVDLVFHDSDNELDFPIIFHLPLFYKDGYAVDGNNKVWQISDWGSSYLEFSDGSYTWYLELLWTYEQ